MTEGRRVSIEKLHHRVRDDLAARLVVDHPRIATPRKIEAHTEVARHGAPRKPRGHAQKALAMLASLLARSLLIALQAAISSGQGP